MKVSLGFHERLNQVQNVSEYSEQPELEDEIRQDQNSREKQTKKKQDVHYENDCIGVQEKRSANRKFQITSKSPLIFL